MRLAVHHPYRTLGLVLCTVALLASTARAGEAYSRRVDYVNDGDTIQVVPAIDGSRAVRYLNVDAPEMEGDTQEPWATEARDHLRGVLPRRTGVTVRTDAEVFDAFGRVLAHVVRDADALNTNRDLLRRGYVVTYVIWPNVAFFEDYRDAQVAAQQDGLGIWDPADPLTELPFEYRLRTGGRAPDKYVGDWFTKSYVQPADYAEVHVNNRVFFFTEADAHAAGFTACPVDGGGYDPACFSAGG